MGQWLLDRLSEFEKQTAIVWKSQEYTYQQLTERIAEWQRELNNRNVQVGESVAVYGDYSPSLCALLLALIANRNIAVPLTSSVRSKAVTFLEIAGAGSVFEFDSNDNGWFYRREVTDDHPLLRQLRAEGEPGLVLFSSGSTGESKAALHNFTRTLEKFQKRRRQFRTLTFLLLDHIGGINTLFHVLSNGGTVVSINERSPEAVCQAMERYRIQLLPTSPTFLNLLLMSEAYKEADLSSLELITYGTEPMPESTLRRLNGIFRGVEFKQTYGLSELGILRSQSRESNSLWMKVGGEGFETKVVDDVLWIRSRSAMVGYLNAPSPFDVDGWFNTEDVVEVDGEYIRILGRTSEAINVGGEKLYAAEVENVLLQLENIRDVTVRGEPNPVMGHVVVASVNLFKPEDLTELRRRVREFCKDRLARYKIPVKVEISERSQFSGRFKKSRNGVL